VDEDTRICAARELEEETGYRAGKLEKLLSLKSTVAFCDELIDVYLATDLMKIGEQHLDEAEDIDIELYDLEDLLLMCYSGELQDAKTVAAIMAYAAKK
jgi:ADP-ribose pyrophosphatase